MDFWVGLVFFFLFTANGKFFSPQVGREKLGAGVGKSGQKAQGRGGGSCWRGSVISQTQELRSCRGSRRHSPAGRRRGHQPPLPWETRWKTELKSILGWERSSSLPGARPRLQRRLLDHGAGVSRWSRGDAVEEGPRGPHLLRGAVRSTQPPHPRCAPLVPSMCWLLLVAPKVPWQPAAGGGEGGQAASGAFPGMLSCRVSQQPRAEPGPAPGSSRQPRPPTPTKGSGHPTATPGRAATPRPRPRPRTHVAACAPVPPVLRCKPAPHPGSSPSPGGDGVLGGVPGAGRCWGAQQLPQGSFCAGDAAGSARPPLGSSRWQSLKGRKQVGRRGGGCPCSCQNLSPPPSQQGERGSLLQRWDVGMCVPPTPGGPGEPQEGPWGDRVPHGEWGWSRARRDPRSPRPPR